MKATLSCRSAKVSLGALLLVLALIPSGVLLLSRKASAQNAKQNAVTETLTFPPVSFTGLNNFGPDILFGNMFLPAVEDGSYRVELMTSYGNLSMDFPANGTAQTFWIQQSFDEQSGASKVLLGSYSSNTYKTLDLPRWMMSFAATARIHPATRPDGTPIRAASAGLEVQGYTTGLPGGNEVPCAYELMPITGD